MRGARGEEGDRAALILLDYHAITADAAFAPGEAFDVSLVLGGFCEDPFLADREKLLAEGGWSFSFSLVRNEALDSPASAGRSSLGDYDGGGAGGLSFAACR